mmetsp:Transcript_71425/g.149248  ORF Transcript_71425/g.149248 Transcript_71425/m.149248 type:complete len:383 (-) Transcript_71425:257-1405(-)
MRDSRSPPRRRGRDRDRGHDDRGDRGGGGGRGGRGDRGDYGDDREDDRGEDGPPGSGAGALPEGTVTSMELAALPAPPISMAFETKHHNEAPTKRRRLKGMDSNSLARLLSGLHNCLEGMVRGSDGVKEVPVHELEEEFEEHWKLRFNARAVGEPNTTAFLKRFPEVFKVRNNGLHTVVEPVTQSDFSSAAIAGLDRFGEEKDASGSTGQFVLGFGEKVAGLLGNLVAEERKAAHAPLPFQFVNYEVVQDLLARLRDGGSREEMQDLVSMVLDPKPHVPKEETNNKASADEPGRGGLPNSEFLNPGPPTGGGSAFGGGAPSMAPPPGMPPPPHGGGGGGGGSRAPGKNPPMRRTADGRNLCRLFQTGRCSYGDNCRFAHEYD